MAHCVRPREPEGRPCKESIPKVLIIEILRITNKKGYLVKLQIKHKKTSKQFYYYNINLTLTYHCYMNQ